MVFYSITIYSHYLFKYLYTKRKTQMITKLKKAIIIMAVVAFCAFLTFSVAACGDNEEWKKWKVTVQPTCTESGERIRYKDAEKTKYEKEEIPPLGHDWGDWHVVTPPTHTSEGVKDRTCKRCGEEDVADIPMVPTTYYIDVLDIDGNRIDRVYTEDDGAYELTEPSLIGYEFIQFLTTGGEPFATSGVIDSTMADGKKVEVVADFAVLPTTTFAQLYERAGAGAKKILIAADITVTGSIYIVGNTEVTAADDYTLTRGDNFGGDMFIVGETENGENTVLSGSPSSLTLSAEEGASLTIDGNKDNMTVDVNGTAILVLNSATVTMGDGVTVKDCKKTANNKLLNSDYKIAYPERIGGAGMIVVNGTFVMNGGTFSGNEVNTDETGSDVVGEGDEKDESTRASSCGGAIYAYADITINGGTFSDNTAARGGAIYSYRKTMVRAATFSRNTAGVYAGAVYLPGSQYSAAYFGEEGATDELVVIDGNTAQKSGGAVFGQMKNSITVYGGTTFKNNVAAESNGGAINTSGAVTIFDGKFLNNRAASKGGAIYMYYSDEELTVRQVSILKATFDGNQATKGGAIAFSSSDPNFDSGAQGVIGSVEPVNAIFVTFKNNIAHATATDDPELPDDNNDGEESAAAEQDPDDNAVLSYNGSGGAIYISRKAKVSLYGVKFENNSAERKGGAIYVTSMQSGVVDHNSYYVGNTAGADDSSDKVTSSGSGGAIYSYGGACLDINGSNFEGNKALDQKYGGGAVYMSDAKDSTITNCLFTKNSAVYNGGAVAVYSGTELTMTDNTFGGPTSEQGNTASNHGGAVYIASNGTTVTDNGSSFTYSRAGNHGGAIFAGTGTILNADGSEFSNNEATQNAGAIYGYTNATLEIKNSSFTANNAHGGSYGGGAMYLSGANVNLENVTFTDNESDKYGGAIAAYSASKVNITNITATGNKALGGNGGVIVTGSANTVVNVFSGTATDNVGSSGSTFNTGKNSTINVYINSFTHNGTFSSKGTINEITDAN